MPSRDITLRVPLRAERGGTPLTWDPEARISTWTSTSLDALVIEGNAAGLRALATALLTLAEPDVPAGTHLHFVQDVVPYVQRGSREFILERADDDPEVPLRTDAAI